MPRAARPAEPAEPAAPPPEPPPAPYEPELLRLSEIMGSLAFLRSLCTAAEAGEWPQRMQALIEAEGTTPGRRERLAGAYNKGYRSYALTYNACTPSATEASNRFLKEGDQLARTIAGRYGG
ncbi:TIGR02301 family protein [Microvirga massiliensis]|uniref:TIGR02301 family protein n=1 Tax=Microvirga massiliensis TaxID=1033741 RepID=UPI000B1663E0